MDDARIFLEMRRAQ
jgi:hypothetical protein